MVKLPFPEWILTILWQVVIHFWKADADRSFYIKNNMPTGMPDVQLEVDHGMRETPRFHIHHLNDHDTAGLWDDTPFWVGFAQETPTTFLEHGDYRHPFQLFLKSFLKNTRRYVKHYPSMELAHKIIMKMPVLTWKCRVCQKYDQWSHQFIENELLEHDTSISASTLLFLLTHQNKKLKTIDGSAVHPSLVNQLDDLCQMLTMALHRFFLEFEKIYEQTSLDPTIIIRNLLGVLAKYPHPIEQIHDFEQACAKDMKSYLYRQFKFLRTNSISIAHFPRDMLIARDLFCTIVGIWSRKQNQEHVSSSPGVLMLMSYMFFQDKALGMDLSKTQPLLVIHPKDDAKHPIVRTMTPPESDVMQEYHPILRPALFSDADEE